MENLSFDTILVLCWIGMLLLLGFILRAKSSIFQKFLIPACITGGIAGLLLKELLAFFVSGQEISSFEITLQNVAYHVFNITFISLGLTKAGRKRAGRARGVVIMGLLIISVAALQFMIGGFSVLLFNSLGYNLHPNFGFLVTMGFEEGPGQALSIGKSWEEFGFVDASVIGISFATLGFLFAIFLGTPLVSWFIRKGCSNIEEEISDSFVKGYFSKPQEAGKSTTHPSTIDPLTFHFSMVLLVYLLTYAFLKALGYILPEDISEMYWGFFFIWGLLIAYVVRLVMEKMGAGNIMDSGLQNRITGWGVDVLVVASISSISLRIIGKYALPILFISALTGVLTLIWIFYLGRRSWREYTYERIAGLYGMETGTIATGLVLVRMLDASFKTPVAVDLAVSGIIALPFMFIMMHIMVAPILWGWNLGSTLAVYSLFLLISTLLVIFMGKTYDENFI